MRTETSTLATRQATVADEDIWEETVTFALESPGEKRVRFLLYKGEQTSGEPDQFLQLIVSVDDR